MALKLKITLVRSLIGRPENQRAVVKALGLRKMHHSVELTDCPSVRGMVKKVEHLLSVEECEA